MKQIDAGQSPFVGIGDATVKESNGVTSYTTREEAEAALKVRANQLGGVKRTGLHVEKLPSGNYTYKY